jgi:hypothetical protein
LTACPPIQSFALERELALRVSGLDGGEEIRVGLAGVEQAADSVASEVHEPERERDSLDALGDCAHAAGLSDSTDRENTAHFAAQNHACCRFRRAALRPKCGAR